jgi:hypothetical protein
MNNERTLSFSKSQQLTEADLQSVSAADGTIQGTLEGTYHTGSGWDSYADVRND